MHARASVGLVARAPNESDGRATDVLLTSKGTKLIKLLRAQVKSLGISCRSTSSSDQRLLQELLHRMLQSRPA